MSSVECKLCRSCADRRRLGARQGRGNGHRAGRGENRQMGAVVVTGEDADCSHCRCETWCRNEVSLNEARTNGWKKGEKKRKWAGGMLFRTKMRVIMRRRNRRRKQREIGTRRGTRRALSLSLCVLLWHSYNEWFILLCRKTLPKLTQPVLKGFYYYLRETIGKVGDIHFWPVRSDTSAAHTPTHR